MSKPILDLIQTLNKETEIYREVLALSLEKREAIKGQNVEALEKITGHEQALVVTLFKLEELREKAMDQIMTGLGVHALETLDDLIPLLMPEDQERVKGAKRDLLVVVKNVSDETRFNTKLMEDKLEWIQLNIDLITQVSADSGKYGKDAVEKAYERKNIFDARV